ncbi:VanZ family protein [Arhodomonas sp. AD133]|uniref:VanZ family protein n=1 Tax=Arhodomonas sp. AD133 TaxID=3415009 RepID=UPI003EBDC162
MSERRAGIGAVILTAYWLATSLGHLAFSKLLVTTWQWPLVGAVRPADHIGWAVLLAAFFVFPQQVRRARLASVRSPTLIGWGLWLAMFVAVDQWLIYSVAEYLHYPQYALLAYLLAWFADPDRSRLLLGPVLLATTLLGIADELLQYTYVTVSYSDYVDFNDFLLNLLGAAAGVLLYYGFRPWRVNGQPPTATERVCAGTVGFAVLSLSLLAVAGLAATGADGMSFLARTPERYGHWLPGSHQGHYWAVPPWLGSLLLGATGALFSNLPRRLR